MDEKLTELKRHWQAIEDLKAASKYLWWDQMTYMPPGGASARSRQIALLERLAHEQLIDPTLGRVLDELDQHEQGFEYESDEASLIRVARRDFERAVKVPAKFIADWYEHRGLAYEAWAVAKQNADFEHVEPYLERGLEFSIKYAEFLQPYDHVADPLIEWYDPGSKAEAIRTIFDDLRPELVGLLDKIKQSPESDHYPVRQAVPASDQLQLAVEVLSQIGFDFDRGRQDEALHPSTTSGSPSDVRITTWVEETDLTKALYASIHEAGHGMYEQGVNPEFEGTPLAHGASDATHESQSRLWENIVGRSREFWTWLLPKLKKSFPHQYEETSIEEAYREVNQVSPSLVRVDADEVTYNLHIMIRFELELQLLEGSLGAKNLPKAWADAYERDLGIRPENDREGVLQDIHWYAGKVGGAFQGYTLGNILSAQLYAAAVDLNPAIPQEIEAGEFSSLQRWLAENVHWHGRKFTTSEVAVKATGRELDIEPYVSYLNSKFGEIYGL